MTGRPRTAAARRRRPALLSPTPRSRATGDALGYAPLVQLALRDCDMVCRRGLTLGEAMAREPQAVEAWLADPCGTPHGGESLLSFITRVGGRLDTRPVEDGCRVVAVAEPSVIRAALVHALKAPSATYWNIDVRPLPRPPSPATSAAGTSASTACRPRSRA